ncbi:hypothetical protein BAY59_05130 [Prauserella coralliicola]|nr:hypothetical protein BAY59_05130 [Prauserella coralliicola]
MKATFTALIEHSGAERLRLGGGGRRAGAGMVAFTALNAGMVAFTALNAGMVAFTALNAGMVAFTAVS